MGKNPAIYELTPKKLSMLRARAKDAVRKARKMNPDLHGRNLEDVAADSMCRCLDALRQSRFHAGENEQGEVYMELKHVFRNTDKFEEWLNKKVRA